MNKLDEFKLFIKNNPNFAEYIKDNSMTWQKFYELFSDLFSSKTGTNTSTYKPRAIYKRFED